MKTLRNVVFILLLAAVFTSIGYVVRKSQVASTQNLTISPRKGHGIAKVDLVTFHPETVASTAVNSLSSNLDLEPDLAMSRSVTRWLRWLEDLERATLADFPQLMRTSRDNPEMTKLMAARWAEVAPRDFFNWIVFESRQGARPDWETLQALFSAWAKQNPAELVSALDATGSGSREWRQAAANALMDVDVELALKVMQEWNIAMYIPRMDALSKWAVADPRHAFDFALAHPAGSVSRSAMKIIGREWAKIDPAAALAYAQQNGGELSILLASSVLSEWTLRSSKDAARWMTSVEPSVRNNLSGDFIKTWAGNDLEGALDWAQSNLSGTMLNRAVTAALSGAAEKDVARAAKLVGGLDNSPAQAPAAAAVARKWFPNSLSAQKPPREAIEWLRSLPGESLKRAVPEVTWGWSASDPEGMAAFLAEGGDFSSWVYSVVGRQLTRKDPVQALDWSGRLPAKAGAEVGQEIFADWRRTQPRPASEWLRQLPANDPRRNSFFDKAIQDSASDPKAAEQFAQFAALDPGAAARVVSNMKLADDRRADLLQMIRYR
jgi:hypothetical protein